MAKRKKTSWQTKLITLLVALVLAAVSLVMEMLDPSDGVAAVVAPVENSILSFEVIDVGQGSATLIQTEQTTVLIDAGEVDQTEKLQAFLKARNVDYIDYAVISHPHTDHYGGYLWLLKNIAVGEVIMPALTEKNTPTNSRFEQLLDALESSNAQITMTDTKRDFDLGSGAVMRLLGPFVQSENLNNLSLCFRVDAGEASFLVTGDGETEVEDALRQGGEDISVDVLVAGHHGSKTSSRPKFVQAVAPKLSAISLGADNSYGHPHQKTLETLSLYGPIFRTDEEQTLSFYTDGSVITLKTGSGKTETFDAREHR